MNSNVITDDGNKNNSINADGNKYMVFSYNKNVHFSNNQDRQQYKINFVNHITEINIKDTKLIELLLN